MKPAAHQSRNERAAAATQRERDRADFHADDTGQQTRSNAASEITAAVARFVIIW